MTDQNTRSKAIIFSIITTVFTIIVALFVAETMLRIKNSNGENYHIEMWKYSKSLKKRSDNPVLGHEHIPGKEAKLQNVRIRINENGMRGADIPAVKNGQRRILFIGSSATLGWGVEEEETLTARLQQKFNTDQKDTLIMNSGIGNYNTVRYVDLFLTKNKDIKPTDIVVNYYPNDAEQLQPGGGNIFIRNSQLAVTFWILANRILAKPGDHSLLDHYTSIYEEDNSGFITMKDSIERLAQYARQNNIKLYLMMMPEVHDLENYEYGFVHETMKTLAAQNGYTYIDGLPSLQKVDDTKSLWAMPGDPHPNALAHGVFADVLYPTLLKNGRR